MKRRNAHTSSCTSRLAAMRSSRLAAMRSSPTPARRSQPRALGLVLLVALGACDDALDQRLAIIDQPRVLAVLAEPAEAKPGAMITYSAIIASPDGPVATPPRWAYCTASKPPTEDNAVSDACLGDTSTNFIALGTQPTITGTLPTNGCILFGPDTPPGNFRPRDPDASGGYYQPIRLDADDLLAFGLSRITCKLPTAPADVARDYDVHYVANTNPALLPITIDGTAAFPSGDDYRATAPDRTVTLTASWPASAVESYLYYAPDSQSLITRREAMRVSWFATSGHLAVDASAVAEDATDTTVSTTWRPAAPGPATLWLILRDSRGGIAAQTIHVDVTP